MPDISLTQRGPTIVWLRRDLRLSDHPALDAACKAGGPVVPVFIHDDEVAALGAAAKQRLEAALAHLAGRLEAMGSRLILRRGEPLAVLRALLAETGARAVYWTRGYTPGRIATDTAVKAALRDDGQEVRSFAGQLLFEPHTVATRTNGPYKVYTPFWKAVRDRPLPDLLPAPARLAAPERWPDSDDLRDWRLAAAMNRGARVLACHMRVGEEAARARLEAFCDSIIDHYDRLRDIPAEDGTSGLSENLALGEISALECWHAGQRALARGKRGAETFLRELVWREFAYHLMWHSPHMLTDNWRRDWDGFPWSETEGAAVLRWKQGRTGIELVDAGMREMYVTGRMHNRARMIVASYLTKHMLTHWRIGQAWFADCLIDWDPASNAMGWQWVAGSGADAAPYFRVFNPDGQRDKFDADRRYIRRWIAEGQARPPATALAFFDAVPRAWGLGPDAAYPAPVVGLGEGRARALDAYGSRGF